MPEEAGATAGGIADPSARDPATSIETGPEMTSPGRSR